VKITHRQLLFSFLGEPALTARQRGIGVVLILKTRPKGFGTADRPVDWEKIALLSGYSERIARQVFWELVAADWLEIREGKQHAYQVVRTRLVVAIARQAEHDERVRAAQMEMAASHPAAAEAGNVS